MTEISEIYRLIDRLAPFDTALPYDNAGLLAGSMHDRVSSVGIVLDITADRVQRAAEQKIELLLSHHPVIFNPLKKLVPGSAPFLLARYGISAICAHTNLDAAQGGVNDCLAQVLELSGILPLADSQYPDLPPIARIGQTGKPVSPEAFAAYTARRLKIPAVRCVPGNRPVSRVAVCGGAGDDLLFPAQEAGADALVTADVHHHMLLAAKETGMTLIDAGHFQTERVVLPMLEAALKEAFPELSVCILPEPAPCCMIGADGAAL